MTKAKAKANGKILAQMLGGSPEWKVKLFQNPKGCWHYDVVCGCVGVAGYDVDHDGEQSYRVTITDEPGVGGSPCHYNGIAYDTRSPRVAVIKACRQFTERLAVDVAAFISVIDAMDSTDSQAAKKIADQCFAKIQAKLKRTKR